MRAPAAASIMLISLAEAGRPALPAFLPRVADADNVNSSSATPHNMYNTIHDGGTSLGNLRVALACEPRRLILYKLVSYPSYPLGD
jgi:hypothetical protein